MNGIVHFARFLVFMETVEHEFLEHLGANVVIHREGRKISWPRVSASCDWYSPVRLGDWLDIQLAIERKGTKSLTYRFRFESGGREIATGRITTVCCEMNAEGPVRAIPIPSFLAERIDEAPRES